MATFLDLNIIMHHNYILIYQYVHSKLFLRKTNIYLDIAKQIINSVIGLIKRFLIL